MNKIEGLCIKHPCHPDDWQEAKTYRQKYFFDKVPMDDPYTWTFDHPDHYHYLLCKEDTILGYAHAQVWPLKGAALRIIVVNEPERGQGLGSHFLILIEQDIKKRGVDILHVESSPQALGFYQNQGYEEKAFDDPEKHETDAQDTPLAKSL